MKNVINAEAIASNLTRGLNRGWDIGGGKLLRKRK